MLESVRIGKCQNRKVLELENAKNYHIQNQKISEFKGRHHILHAGQFLNARHEKSVAKGSIQYNIVWCVLIYSNFKIQLLPSIAKI